MKIFAVFLFDAKFVTKLLNYLYNPVYIYIYQKIKKKTPLKWKMYPAYVKNFEI